MKNYFLTVLITVFFLGFCLKGNSCSNEHFKQSELAFSKVVGSVGKKLAKRHQMHVIGTGGSEDDEGISLISLTFERHQGPLSKNDGRKMVIEIIDELIKTINADERIRPFLRNYPFKADNFEILIINSTIDNDDLFDPDIEVFSYSRNELGYRTRDPDDHYRYKSETFEPYSEALEQVKRDFGNMES